MCVEFVILTRDELTVAEVYEALQQRENMKILYSQESYILQGRSSAGTR
jgi:hypothetical protein